jgi:hypothetical protein
VSPLLLTPNFVHSPEDVDDVDNFNPAFLASKVYPPEDVDVVLHVPRYKAQARDPEDVDDVDVVLHDDRVTANISESMRVSFFI